MSAPNGALSDGERDHGEAYAVARLTLTTRTPGPPRYLHEISLHAVENRPLFSGEKGEG